MKLWTIYHEITEYLMVKAIISLSWRTLEYAFNYYFGFQILMKSK